MRVPAGIAVSRVAAQIRRPVPLNQIVMREVGVAVVDTVFLL